MNTHLSKIDKSRQRLNELSRREAFSHYIKHGSVPPVWNEIMDASHSEEKFLRYLARYHQALSHKANVVAEERSTTHYIWRTKGDGRVQSEHAANDGKLFSWNERPVTGHPGEEYNCRCIAEPYVEGATEYATHYFFGNGRSVTLLEIGHLQEIAEQYAYHDGKEGALRRLSGQIASDARVRGGGAPYEIMGEWTANFVAQVFTDESRSQYFHKEGK